MSERVIGWDELKVGQRVRIERSSEALLEVFEGPVLKVHGDGYGYARIGDESDFRVVGNSIRPKTVVTLLAEPLPPEPPVGSAAAMGRHVALRDADCWRWANTGDRVDPDEHETAWARLHADGFVVVRHGWDGEQ